MSNVYGVYLTYLTCWVYGNQYIALGLKERIFFALLRCDTLTPQICSSTLCTKYSSTIFGGTTVALELTVHVENTLEGQFRLVVAHFFDGADSEFF